VHYALCTMLYTSSIFSVHYTLRAMHYTLCAIHYALYTMSNYTLCDMYYKLCIDASACDMYHASMYRTMPVHYMHCLWVAPRCAVHSPPAHHLSVHCSGTAVRASVHLSVRSAPSVCSGSGGSVWSVFVLSVLSVCSVSVRLIELFKSRSSSLIGTVSLSASVCLCVRLVSWICPKVLWKLYHLSLSIELSSCAKGGQPAAQTIIRAKSG
jgi:hypothetical protein